MKKFLLFTLLLIVILGAVFYQPIIDTLDFYQYQKDNADKFAAATLNWKQIPFTSTGNKGLVTDTLTFNKLQLPVPFGTVKKSNGDAAMAVGISELITVTHSSAAADFFRMYNFSDSEKKVTCAFLSQTSGRGACTSNYDFYHAFLELNETDIHAFASIEDKQLYNRLMTLRAELIPTNTVSGFETSSLRGFWFTFPEGHHHIIEAFDSDDQQYRVEFQSLDQADVAFVLSSINYLD